MPRRTMLALAILVMGGASPENADEAARIAGKLQGEWVAVEVEVQGKKLPKEEAAEHYFTIREGEFIFRDVTGTSRRKSILAKIDPSKSPMEMDLVALERRETGMTQRLIFELDGDRLKFCGPISGDKRPAGFQTKAKDGFMCFTLKRVK